MKAYYDVKGFMLVMNPTENINNTERTACIRMPVYDYSNTLQEINFYVSYDGEYFTVAMKTSKNELMDRRVYTVKHVKDDDKAGTLHEILGVLIRGHGLKLDRSEGLSKTKVEQFARLASLKSYKKGRLLTFINSTSNVYMWRELTGKRQREITLDVTDYEDKQVILMYMVFKKGEICIEDAIRVKGSMEEVLTKAKQMKALLLQQLQEEN